MRRRRERMMVSRQSPDDVRGISLKLGLTSHDFVREISVRSRLSRLRDGLLNVKGDMQELLGLRLFVLGDGRIRDRFESLAGI